MYERFEQLLKEKGVTVAQMCRDTGIRESTMSNWKNRKENGGAVSVDTLAKIAAYFGVSLDFFVNQGVGVGR